MSSSARGAATTARHTGSICATAHRLSLGSLGWSSHAQTLTDMRGPAFRVMPIFDPLEDPVDDDPDNGPFDRANRDGVQQMPMLYVSKYNQETKGMDE